MTYGKIFSKLYRGSMVGAGIEVYALMPYIISEAMPDKVHGGYIEMNPVLIAATFGTTADVIERAIEYLCRPDPKTTTPGDEGRRIVKIGPFAYRVVNYAYYKSIQNEEDRREQNRLAQEKFRQKREARKAKRGGSGGPSLNERLAEKAIEDGDEKEADRLERMKSAELEAKAAEADMKRLLDAAAGEVLPPGQ
jgi:hypothetical protein